MYIKSWLTQFNSPLTKIWSIILQKICPLWNVNSMKNCITSTLMPLTFVWADKLIATVGLTLFLTNFLHTTIIFFFLYNIHLYIHVHIYILQVHLMKLYGQEYHSYQILNLHSPNGLNKQFPVLSLIFQETY